MNITKYNLDGTGAASISGDADTITYDCDGEVTFTKADIIAMALAIGVTADDLVKEK